MMRNMAWIADPSVFTNTHDWTDCRITIADHTLPEIEDVIKSYMGGGDSVTLNHKVRYEITGITEEDIEDILTIEEE